MKRNKIMGIIAICTASMMVLSLPGCKQESKATANTEITDTADTHKKLGGVTYDLSENWKRDASDRQDTAEYTYSSEDYNYFHFKVAYTKASGANQAAMIESYEYQMIKTFPGITNGKTTKFGAYTFNSYTQSEYQTDDGKGKKNVEVYICSDGTRTAYFEFIYGEKDKALDEIEKIMDSVKIENMSSKKDTAKTGKTTGESPLVKTDITGTENMEFYISENWEQTKDGYKYTDGTVKMTTTVSRTQGTEEEIIGTAEETITSENGSPDKKDQIAANGITVYEYSYDGNTIDPVSTRYYVFTDTANVIQIKMESEKMEEYDSLITNLIKSISIKSAEQEKTPAATESESLTGESSDIQITEVKPGEESH